MAISESISNVNLSFSTIRNIFKFWHGLGVLEGDDSAPQMPLLMAPHGAARPGRESVLPLAITSPKLSFRTEDCLVSGPRHPDSNSGRLRAGLSRVTEPGVGSLQTVKKHFIKK